MSTAEEIRISIRNIELAALHWPSNSKTHILALHGWLDNAESFAPLAQMMPDYNFVALDFPGHGLSEHRPAGEILHYFDYIADVHEVLTALNWERCVLIGHSMGAGIASLYASAFAEKLNGLVCLDGLGPITCQTQELVPRLSRAISSTINSTSKSKKVYESVEQAVQARILVGDLSESSAKRLVRRNLNQVDNGYVWRSDARLRLPSLYYLSEQQARAYLSEIQVPTQMIRPADSVYKAQKILKARAALIKNLSWIDVPGGHHAHMDHAQQVLTPIDNFIQKVVKGVTTA